MDKTSPNIGVITVPRSCDDTILWDQIIEKYKGFRLNALQDSPDAFSSTYAREIAFTKDIWAGRLSNPRATHVGAIDFTEETVISDDTSKLQALVKNDWAAMMVMMRPEDGGTLSATKSPWTTISGGTAPSDSPPEEAMLVILNGVFVAPGYRNKGIGRTILERTFEVGKAMAKNEGFSRVVFQVGVDEANDKAFRLYEKAGFQQRSMEQLMMTEKVKDGLKIPPRKATIILMDRVVSVS